MQLPKQITINVSSANITLLIQLQVNKGHSQASNTIINEGPANALQLRVDVAA